MANDLKEKKEKEKLPEISNTQNEIDEYVYSKIFCKVKYHEEKTK